MKASSRATSRFTASSVSVCFWVLLAIPTVFAASLGYKSGAIELANAGRDDEALKLFQRHVNEFPDDSAGWNNVGVASLRASGHQQDLVRSHEQLIESAQHFRRSLALNFLPSTVDNYERVRRRLAAQHHVELPLLKNDALSVDHRSEFCDPSTNDGSTTTHCGWDPTTMSTQAISQQLHDRCQAGSVSLRVSKKERKSGLLDLHNLLSAREAMKVCGVVVFERLFRKVGSFA